MNKTLLIVQDENNYFFPYVDSPEIDIQNAYKHNTFLFKIMRKLPVISLLSYGKWKKDINKYQKIILFDSIYNNLIGSFIGNKITKDQKVFVYSWNTILDKKQEKIIFHAKKRFKVYSFDKFDCNKYDLSYAPMVYCENAVELNNEKIDNNKYDVCFVGKDKGRTDYLYNLYQKFTEKKVKCKFYILGNKIEEYESSGFCFISNYMSYKDSRELINSSKAVLDIQQEGQEGITIRIVEALFCNKKVITNKVNIADYDFYSNKNIFCLGVDNFDNIVDFINCKNEIIDSSIMEKYEITTWINVFV